MSRETDVIIALKVMGLEKVGLYKLCEVRFKSWPTALGTTEEWYAPWQDEHLKPIIVADLGEEEWRYWENGSAHSLPHYSSEIDDAFQMEERIKELGLQDEYADVLKEIVGKRKGIILRYNYFDLIHATAEERAKAALEVMEER